MAVYFNLGLVARTHADAEACVAYFAAQRLVDDGEEVPLEVASCEGGGGWLVSAWPRGMNFGSPSGSARRLTTEDARARIAAVFDGWLRTAPPFQAAFFGAEAFDFFLDDGLAQLDAAGVDGLVVDAALWTVLGGPAAAQELAPGRWAWPRTRPV
jgi:hypothetical protein